MTQAMLSNWLLSAVTGLLGTLIALVVAPQTVRLARRWGAVDKPEARRVHQGLMPRLGGIALVAGSLPAMAVALTHTDGHHLPLVGGMLGALIVFAIGTVDDCRRLPWWVKLVGITGAAVLAVALGVRINMVRYPLGGGRLLSLGWSSWMVTAIWLIVLTNAFNLIDGLDGLAGGLTLISGTTLVVMALGKGGPLLLVGFWAAGLAGAALGFLYYNFNPASMIMGDGGAYFLGFSLGCASVTGAMKTPVGMTLAIPLLVFAIPLVDTTMAVLRRLWRRQPIMSAPDREHLHHRLLDMGMSQRQVVLVIYLLSALLCAWAVALYRG